MSSAPTSMPPSAPVIPYATPASVPATAPSGASWWRVVRTILAGTASMVAVSVVLFYGLSQRQAMWTQSAPVRFRFDLDNGANQCYPIAVDPKTGKAADWKTFRQQYFARYDQIAKDKPSGNFGLDYGPLRLLLLSLWDHHLLAMGKDPRQWKDPDVGMLRGLNTLMDFVAALLASALVWTWIARTRGAPDPRPWFGPLVGRWARVVWRRCRGRRFAADDRPAPPQWPQDPANYPADVRPLNHMLLDGRAWMWGGMAGALVWLSPALIVVGNGWPQWDGWVVPFFLLAALLCSWRCWFSAGIVIAAGAMFKGQLLLGAPVLVLWPLFSGRYSLTFRILAGAIVGFAIIGSPWLLQERPKEISTDSILPKSPAPTVRSRFRTRAPAPAPTPAATQPAPSGLDRALTLVDQRLNSIPNWGFLLTTVAGLALVARWFFLTKNTWGWGACGGAAAVLISWPWWRSSSQWWFWGGLALIDLLLMGPWLLPRKHIAAWAVAVLAVAVWYCAPLFGGSIAWWRMGVTYGTDHYPEMRMGPTYNLAAILGDRYGWKLKEPVFDEPKTPARSRFDEPRPATPPSKLDLRTFLRGCYILALVLCGIGAAVQTRRFTPRVLVALAAPWVLFFALLPQMHERYLVYAGGIGAIAVGAGLGFGLLHRALAVLGAYQMLMVLMGPNTKIWPELAARVFKTFPDAAWAVLVIAAVFLWCSLSPGRRPKATAQPAIR